MTTVSHRLILAVLGAAVIPLLSLAFARIFLQIDIASMTRDVNAIAGVHPLSGILSSLGILLWWTSVSVYLFTAYLLRSIQSTSGVGFLVYSGLLSTYLGLDDLFQVHEHLAPGYLKVPELVVYALLGSATTCYLWRYRRLLRQPDAVLLLFALAFLFISVAVDAVWKLWMWHPKDWKFLFEDGAKWLGICYWTAFCVVRCSRELGSMLPMASSKPPPSEAGLASQR